MIATIQTQQTSALRSKEQGAGVRECNMEFLGKTVVRKAKRLSLCFPRLLFALSLSHLISVLKLESVSRTDN
jgi:hypothetical protein